MRIRQCDNPMPKHNGLKCYGDSSENGNACNSGVFASPVYKKLLYLKWHTSKTDIA